ncbi:g1612 [Coccomyxa elongata]
MREHWKASGILLLVALSLASARVVPQPGLLSEQRRDDCTLESQRLFHCASFNAPNSMLTDKQKELCCEAVQSFNLNGCFCGWGRAADMNPWTRDVLTDLASALHSCNVGVIPCIAGEEYLQDGDVAGANSGDDMLALQAADTAVSRMVAQDGWGVSHSRLPDRLASSLQPLFDLVPSYSQGAFDEDDLAPGGFDIEVEVEQEGGDSEQLSATMAQLSRWMGALLGGDEPMPGGTDSLDTSADSAYDNAPLQADTLGGVVTQIMQLVNTILNGTDAQVEVAVEITVETTTTTSSATRFSSSRKDISNARPLMSRVNTAPAAFGAGATAGRAERMVTETVQQAFHGAQPHCWMQRLAHRVSDNPARFFAILAGVSFVVLLATLIAQVTMALVCEVQRQMAPEEAEPVTNPLLAPELTTPLLNARGELHESSL